MFVELLSEPAYIQAQNLLLYKLRLQVEGVAVIARTLVTVALAIFFKVSSIHYFDYSMDIFIYISIFRWDCWLSLMVSSYTDLSFSSVTGATSSCQARSRRPHPSSLDFPLAF